MGLMNKAPLSLKRVQQWIGRQAYYHASVGSTNEEAKRVAAAGCPAGTLVIADEQTAGKGRLGRRWVAPPNTSLLMSLVFRPALAPGQVHRLTMLCSLAAAQAIKAETGLLVRLKWPNDLVVPQYPLSTIRYRKLAGVLTEASFSGEKLLFVVVGMGINVNVDPAELESLAAMRTPVTSLSAELGRPVERETLLTAILQQIESRYPQAISGQIRTDWAGRLVTLGQKVTVTTAQGQLWGLAEGVNQDGALLLRDLARDLHVIVAGDVSLR